MTGKKTASPTLFQSVATAFRELQSVIRDTRRISEESELLLVASSLAYTTILSIIPALAVSFSIFKAFGGLEKLYTTLEPLIVSTLAENSGEEAMKVIRKFIENARAGAIGAGGMVGLLFTTMSMVSSIDKAIHRIWRLKNERDWFQRVTQYWFFVTLGPLGLSLLVGYASTVAAGEGQAVMQYLPGGTGLFLGVASCLFFLYKGVPTCKVDWRAALLAAFAGSALWNLARWGYAIYTSKAVTYDKIYGGLSAIPILLLWIYIVWLVTLVGAALSAALQKRTQASEASAPRPAPPILATLLALLTLLAPPASEAGQNKGHPTKTGKPHSSLRAQDPRDQDLWYTVTIENGFHYAYYNDKTEYRDGKIHFQNQFWKNEEGYLNQESLGGVALDDPSLTPLFFNFRSAYRTSETLIDGTIEPGARWVQARIKKAGKELPIVRRSLSPQTFLSSHFALWIGRNLMNFSESKLVSFRALIEDNLSLGFGSIPGTVKRLPPDEYARKMNAVLLSVDHRDAESKWWVDATGAPFRIEMPRAKTTVQRVSKSAAEAFLKNSTPGDPGP